jgi:hypothetical protein
MQFFTVTFVQPGLEMPTPESGLGPVMECPAQFRIMLFAPIVMPVLVEQGPRLIVSVVLPVIV